MIRTRMTPALALGAVLAATGFAAAGDTGPAKARPDDGFTMTLGGTGTAAANPFAASTAPSASAGVILVRIMRPSCVGPKTSKRWHPGSARRHPFRL